MANHQAQAISTLRGTGRGARRSHTPVGSPCCAASHASDNSYFVPSARSMHGSLSHTSRSYRISQSRYFRSIRLEPAWYHHAHPEGVPEMAAKRAFIAFDYDHDEDL